jgi:hypothetical protein
MSTDHARYRGKPLLRLLECYVLWCIHELSQADINTLQEMTPKLQEVYHMQGEWQSIIAAVMEWPSDFPEEIRALWQRNIEIARRSGVMLTPQQFAEMFADQNIAT